MSSDLQVWNNAAFDEGDSEDLSRVSWSNMKSAYVNQSLESDRSKENLTPVPVKFPVFLQSSIGDARNREDLTACKVSWSNLKSANVNQSLESVCTKENRSPVSVSLRSSVSRDENKIDVEIQEVQREISRLSSKLEFLQLEKARAEKRSKTTEKRGRIVPAKFMEQQKPIFKIQESSAKPKINRRGFSLGPNEILGTGTRSRLLNKQETNITTPVTQNRRKSCFWKLQEIDETKVTKERGKSSSPKKTVSKIPMHKQAATSIGQKKPINNKGGVLATIQPKKLFGGKDKIPSIQKPVKSGRFVASRYIQTPTAADGRKRSLPENSGDNRVKKRWEIPSDVSFMNKKPTLNFSAMKEEIPRIKIIRCVNESPRDSGAAKKVAELAGRSLYFSPCDEEEGSVCQVLNFEE